MVTPQVLCVFSLPYLSTLSGYVSICFTQPRYFFLVYIYHIFLLYTFFILPAILLFHASQFNNLVLVFISRSPGSQPLLATFLPLVSHRQAFFPFWHHLQIAKPSSFCFWILHSSLACLLAPHLRPTMNNPTKFTLPS